MEEERDGRKRKEDSFGNFTMLMLASEKICVMHTPASIKSNP